MSPDQNSNEENEHLFRSLDVISSSERSTRRRWVVIVIGAGVVAVTFAFLSGVFHRPVFHRPYDGMVAKLRPGMYADDVMKALGSPLHKGNIGDWTSLIYDDGANHPPARSGEKTLLMVAFDPSGTIRGWIIVEGDIAEDTYAVLENSELFPRPALLTALDETLKTNRNYFAFYTTHLMSYEVAKYENYGGPDVAPETAVPLTIKVKK